MTEIRGIHVLSAFVLAFSIIIAVNLTLAFNAVRTFPGLEVKNSYVASQSFQADRHAQEALGWEVSAQLVEGQLRVEVLSNGAPIAPQITKATFGRATHVQDDLTPEFGFDGRAFVAPVGKLTGNWNLRLELMAEDGTRFQQRIIVRGAS